MKLFALTLTFFLANSCSSIISYRHHCPTYSGFEKPSFGGNYSKFFEENNIVLANNIEQYYLEHFIEDYKKIPLPLRTELVKNHASIRLIQGSGVSDDPTWDQRIPPNKNDWRGFGNVNGTGGRPYDRSPSRVVVNKMNVYHTSVVLHETGHNLDNLYEWGTITKDPKWNALLKSDPGSEDFLKVICDHQYCYTSKAEGFAELFSYYHSCQGTREHMEKEVPKLAHFFKDFTSVRAFKKN